MWINPDWEIGRGLIDAKRYPQQKHVQSVRIAICVSFPQFMYLSTMAIATDVTGFVQINMTHSCHIMCYIIHISSTKGFDSVEFKFHCQHEAVVIANSILPVPEDYPLADGLPDDFRNHFLQLCELIKEMYIDMAKQPDAYGLVLTDYTIQPAGSQSKDNGLIRKSRNSVNRLPDTLFRLSQNGEVHNHQLVVSLPDFKESLKQTAAYGLSAVTK